MTTVKQVTHAMQHVLQAVALTLAIRTKAIIRKRTFDGAKLAQALIFGWMENPNATLEELAQAAAACGAPVTPQAIDQKFTAETAEFMKQLLGEAIGQVVQAKPVPIELLKRFTSVMVEDSTVITLPDELKDIWPGCGGSEGASAASIKFHTRYDLLHGTLTAAEPTPGKTSDQNSPAADAPLPKGSLVLRDLGYFKLKTFAELHEQDVFWISRLKANTAIYNEQGERLKLAEFLQEQVVDQLDQPIVLGVTAKLSCRLVAVRCSEEVANNRKRKLRKQCKKKGRTPSKEQLALCEWTLFVTNLPLEKASLAEVLVLARARWQVELLFKLWKQHGCVDKSLSKNRWRILTEIFAKLIGLVIQHWLLLASCWACSRRSATKASRHFQKQAYCLITALKEGSEAIIRVLKNIEANLQRTAKINKRKDKQSTYKILEDPECLDFLT